MDDLIEAAWQAEEALLTMGVRSDADRLAELLASGFYEIGQSGRRWSRDEIIDALVGDGDEHPDAILTEREAVLVGCDTVLLSYGLEFVARRSRRSSLWRQDGDRMRCFFHQGTPLPAG
ncbi:hypothetical protein SAMN06295879_0414 [Agreia bicolorata]|uniref:DUF4440 domain-containing protein n=1 Tax=Agreia bicolorata TaxID=110935 RepID=A0A1T4WYS1_9MICO|nr:nuclear transport factor 2 family protein [Agreia bicolorata]SKA81995.1 hypothetical protein SAMN06295879_0414 [Agreia bicolorata]